MMLDSGYSKQLFRLTRSSSNFGVSDRTLLSIIDGSGGLLIRRRRRSRTPPRLPRLSCGRVLVCVARMAAGRCSGGVDWRGVGRKDSKASLE